MFYTATRRVSLPCGQVCAARPRAWHDAVRAPHPPVPPISPAADPDLGPRRPVSGSGSDSAPEPDLAPTRFRLRLGGPCPADGAGGRPEVSVRRWAEHRPAGWRRRGEGEGEEQSQGSSRAGAPPSPGGRRSSLPGGRARGGPWTRPRILELTGEAGEGRLALALAWSRRPADPGRRRRSRPPQRAEFYPGGRPPGSTWSVSSSSVPWLEGRRGNGSGRVVPSVAPAPGRSRRPEPDRPAPRMTPPAPPTAPPWTPPPHPPAQRGLRRRPLPSGTGGPHRHHAAGTLATLAPGRGRLSCSPRRRHGAGAFAEYRVRLGRRRWMWKDGRRASASASPPSAPAAGAGADLGGPDAPPPEHDWTPASAPPDPPRPVRPDHQRRAGGGAERVASTHYPLPASFPRARATVRGRGRTPAPRPQTPREPSRSPPAGKGERCRAVGAGGRAVSLPAMNDEERYLFDLQGFLVLPGALSPDEVGTLNELIDGSASRSRGRASRASASADPSAGASRSATCSTTPA